MSTCTSIPRLCRKSPQHHPGVILSEAKNLRKTAGTEEIVHYVQDDNGAFPTKPIPQPLVPNP